MREEIDRTVTVFAYQAMAAWHLWAFCCTLLARGFILVSSLKCLWTNYHI